MWRRWWCWWQARKLERFHERMRRLGEEQYPNWAAIEPVRNAMIHAYLELLKGIVLIVLAGLLFKGYYMGAKEPRPSPPPPPKKRNWGP